MTLADHPRATELASLTAQAARVTEAQAVLDEERARLDESIAHANARGIGAPTIAAAVTDGGVRMSRQRVWEIVRSLDGSADQRATIRP